MFDDRCTKDYTCVLEEGHVGDCKFTSWPSSEELKKIMAENTVNVETKQVGGDHYIMLDLQLWEIIDRLNLDFFEGSALKYLLRWRNKWNGVEDLKKCQHYIEYLIKREQKNGSV